ncbi:MAG: hypothetical protein EGQ88_03145 [Prevotellamassilia timonensis]|jgi:hypothetical protein|uniref:hypothetical protein n=1 Tax=Prevotellamassilia timonensis TaxID=1852370 RepID=UPI00307E85B6|nr:hypothetical protein [Prevotellamassilia timonensis]
MKRIFLCLLMSLTAVLGFSNILDDSEQSQRFELYPTQNTFNFLKLDKKTGKIYQVQWSLEGEKEFSITLNGIDLSQFSTDGNCFKLYPTKNMWQFILLDGASGRAWHVQWGFEEKNRWIKRIEEFNR